MLFVVHKPGPCVILIILADNPSHTYDMYVMYVSESPSAEQINPREGKHMQTGRRHCSVAGCRELVSFGRCAAHEAQYLAKRQRYPDTRPPASKRGYGAAWTARRASMLARPEHQLCARCYSRGRVVSADVVHHVDHDQHNNSPENLQALCRTCHEVHHGRMRESVGR